MPAKLFKEVGKPVRSKEFFQSLDMLSPAVRKMALGVVEEVEREKN